MIDVTSIFSAARRGATTYAAFEAPVPSCALAVKTMASPVGPLRLVASEQSLVAILWESDDGRRVRLGPAAAAPETAVLIEAERQLSAYFDGRLRRFTLPLVLRGTSFQRCVWEALLEIPFGETRSYGEIARALGRPSAARAVGAANGRNPISIIVPCHRLRGASGALIRFAGGLDAKRYLLDHEAHLVGEATRGGVTVDAARPSPACGKIPA